LFQLLEAIGAVEKDNKKKSGPYQDAVSGSPYDEELDAYAAGTDEDGANVSEGLELSSIKASVQKVCFWHVKCFFLILTMLQLRKIVQSVRSSPQRRQHWYQLISPGQILVGAHMLILDVKTRWSSTHQMLSESLFECIYEQTKYLSNRPCATVPCTY